jgi:hypothetical protein
MFHFYQSIPIYRTQCRSEKIYTDTNKDNAEASSSNAKFGRNRPEDSEVSEAGFPWWIVKLKPWAENVTFEVEWKVSVPNCTMPK